MKEIRVKFAGIEKSKDGKLSIIYVPDTRQVLMPGKRYQITIEGLSYEEHAARK